MDGKEGGVGEMMTTDVVPMERIDYHLKFIKPWASESDGYVEMNDEGDGTKVSWSFYGKTPFPLNAMNLFMNMDRMIGKDFEKGLALLKNICEKQSELIRSYQVREVHFPAKNYAVVREEVAMAEFSNFFARSMGTLMQEIQKRGLKMTGAPCGIYFTWDEATQTSDMAAAVPIGPSVRAKDLTVIQIPATKAYVIDYYGTYESVANAHYAFNIFLAKSNLTQKLPVIEEYITDPMTEKDSSKWLTRIYYFAE